MNDLGKLIQRHEWTQDHFAAQLGITPEHLWRLLNDRVPVRISLIYQISEILSIPVAAVAAEVIPELQEYVYGKKAIKTRDVGRAEEAAG